MVKHSFNTKGNIHVVSFHFNDKKIWDKEHQSYFSADTQFLKLKDVLMKVNIINTDTNNNLPVKELSNQLLLELKKYI